MNPIKLIKNIIIWFFTVPFNLKEARTWKILFVISWLLMAYAGYRMFVTNYEIQSPVISKRAEKYIDVWNERAVCLSQIEKEQDFEADPNMSENNKQALRDWKKPVEN